MPPAYSTVFQVTDKPFAWWFAFLWVVPLLIGGILWWWHRSHLVSSRTLWLMWFFPGFAILWLCTACIPMIRDYRRIQALYRERRYSIVEGPVEAFQPMPPQGHSLECFRVQSQRFCYSGWEMTPSFNQDSAHGGPIHAGLVVRVGYIDGEIVLLQLPSKSSVN